MTVAPEKLSPLALAYIGDAVYELAVPGNTCWVEEKRITKNCTAVLWN